MLPRILIVDDEKDVVELLCNYFDLCGYDVLSAYDGKKALEKIFFLCYNLKNGSLCH